MSPTVLFLNRCDNGDRPKCSHQGRCSGLAAVGGRGQQVGLVERGRDTRPARLSSDMWGVQSCFQEVGAGSQIRRRQQHCQPTLQTRKVEGTMASSPMTAAACRAPTRCRALCQRKPSPPRLTDQETRPPRHSAQPLRGARGHGPRPRHAQQSSPACGTCGRVSWNTGGSVVHLLPLSPESLCPRTPAHPSKPSALLPPRGDSPAPRCAEPLQPGTLGGGGLLGRYSLGMAEAA